MCNVHFHSLVLDGVYTRPTPTARPVFHRLPAPTDADIAALLTRLQRRVRRLLARRGRLSDDAEATDPFAAQEPLFAGAVAASLQGRVALGPRAGQPLRRLRSAAAASDSPPRCARLAGFSLHADVAVPAPRRDRLKHLARYLLRPPLALERLPTFSRAMAADPKTKARRKVQRPATKIIGAPRHQQGSEPRLYRISGTGGEGVQAGQVDGVLDRDRLPNVEPLLRQTSLVRETSGSTRPLKRDIPGG